MWGRPSSAVRRSEAPQPSRRACARPYSRGRLSPHKLSPHPPCSALSREAWIAISEKSRLSAPSKLAFPATPSAGAARGGRADLPVETSDPPPRIFPATRPAGLEIDVL